MSDFLHLTIEGARRIWRRGSGPRYARGQGHRNVYGVRVLEQWPMTLTGRWYFEHEVPAEIRADFQTVKANT